MSRSHQRRSPLYAVVDCTNVRRTQFNTKYLSDSQKRTLRNKYGNTLILVRNPRDISYSSTGRLSVFPIEKELLLHHAREETPLKLSTSMAIAHPPNEQKDEPNAKPTNMQVTVSPLHSVTVEILQMARCPTTGREIAINSSVIKRWNWNEITTKIKSVHQLRSMVVAVFRARRRTETSGPYRDEFKFAVNTHRGGKGRYGRNCDAICLTMPSLMRLHDNFGDAVQNPIPIIRPRTIQRARPLPALNQSQTMTINVRSQLEAIVE